MTATKPLILARAACPHGKPVDKCVACEAEQRAIGAALKSQVAPKETCSECGKVTERVYGEERVCFEHWRARCGLPGYL